MRLEMEDAPVVREGGGAEPGGSSSFAAGGSQGEGLRCGLRCAVEGINGSDDGGTIGQMLVREGQIAGHASVERHGRRRETREAVEVESRKIEAHNCRRGERRQRLAVVGW